MVLSLRRRQNRLLQRQSERIGPGHTAACSSVALLPISEAELSDFEGALLELDVQNGLFPPSIDDNERAAMVGLRYGRNRQSGNFVSGFELDVSFSDLNGEAGFEEIDPNPSPIFNGVNTVTSYQTDVDKFMTARLRAGYSSGNTLFYATGGLAYGDVENTFTLELPNLPAAAGGAYSNAWGDDGWRMGYVLGAGVEQKLTDRMSISADVMRFDLDDVNVEATDPAVFGANSISYDFQNTGYVARIGVNFAF